MQIGAKRPNISHIAAVTWYLDEVIRRDGPGNNAASSAMKCNMCRKEGLDTTGVYWCLDCDGCQLLCACCVTEDHSIRSLHNIEKWNHKYFEQCSLRELDLVVHLGHEGRKCPNPGHRKTKLVVGHTNGFHEVDVIFCACISQEEGLVPDWTQLLRHGWFPASRQRINTTFTIRMLEFFHELTLQGKTSLYDFHKTLCRVTDNSGRVTSWLHLVLRQWRNLQLLKRSGRGHEPNGIEKTPEGACIIECAACPHLGRNLPEDWTNAPPHVAWLYVLFLMLDANFRLKLKDRSFKDVELSAGWGYFVEDSKYQSFIGQMGQQQEVNSCSAEHNAIRNANVPHGGYLVSGTAGCLWNGLADLQKGEKYCTMDYILLSTLIGTSTAVFLTYDIACQYSKNFARRVTDFPPCMRLDSPRVSLLRWAIPGKHWRVHGEKDHSQFSLNYLPYSGRTYGEGIETGWAHMNPVSMSMKEMAPSARREVLNDHWSLWNWQKTLGFGTLLLRNLQQAVNSQVKHEAIFKDFNKTFSSETIAKWKEDIERWEADPFSSPDPFIEDGKSATLNEIKLMIATEESLDVARGILSLHKVSPLLFLQIGLELEDAQHVIRLRAKTKQSPADLVSLQTKRNALAHRIEAWRKVQEVYMPCAGALLDAWTASAAATMDDNDNSNNNDNNDDDVVMPAHVEDIPLFLPSSLPAHLRADGSVKSLTQKETWLRVAIADDALADIRHLCRTMAGVSQFKQLNVSGTGQKANTRVQNLYSKFKGKVTTAATRYRAAYAALQVLQPDGDWTMRLRALADKDITGPGNNDGDRPLGEGHHKMSWIWLVPRSRAGESTNNTDPAEFGQSMQAKWSKICAHVRRWAEESQLLQEEMRRVVVFFDWKARWWREQARLRCGNISASLASGLTAYAEKQAHMYEALSLKFYNMWNPFFTARRLLAQWAPPHSTSTQHPQPQPEQRARAPVEDDLEEYSDVSITSNGDLE
ncbi:hypothetical protein BC835DRAFT_1409185 [Cytidiella melzeri]|nr:hypothetical protein BC835DRAFT_1409185 [Cytidiella melzeri]